MSSHAAAAASVTATAAKERSADHGSHPPILYAMHKIARGRFGIRARAAAIHFVATQWRDVAEPYDAFHAIPIVRGGRAPAIPFIATRLLSAPSPASGVVTFGHTAARSNARSRVVASRQKHRRRRSAPTLSLRRRCLLPACKHRSVRVQCHALACGRLGGRAVAPLGARGCGYQVAFRTSPRRRMRQRPLPITRCWITPQAAAPRSTQP